MEHLGSTRNEESGGAALPELCGDGRVHKRKISWLDVLTTLKNFILFICFMCSQTLPGQDLSNLLLTFGHYPFSPDHGNRSLSLPIFLAFFCPGLAGRNYRAEEK